MKEDTQQNIGKVLEGRFNRDAIHIAVAPVFAAKKLYPGDHVGMVGPNQAGGDTLPIGIVDPFLTRPVMPGQQFFMFIYPNTITSLRHEWVHPVLDDPSASAEWLKAFAAEHRIPYEDLLTETDAGHVCFGDESGQDAMRDSDIAAEFWRHYEAVTGSKVSPDQRERTYFRCAC